MGDCEKMKLTAGDYKELATLVESGLPIDLSFYDQRAYEFELAEAFPKQRPRKGKSGVFTPPETRKYEALVKQWGIDSGMKPVHYPVAVKLHIRDVSDDADLRKLSAQKLAYHSHGDLDNYAKAILDGLNKVLVKDDRQIVKLTVTRGYSSRRGFSLHVQRAGLSANELEQLKKFL